MLAQPRQQCIDRNRDRSAPPRAWYTAIALVTVALGLVVHANTGGGAAAVQDKLGDALWASMIVWWISALAPRAPLAIRIAAALATCVAVECSQLYHTATLDAVRQTTLGHLVLGSGFDARDLLAYTAGVLLAGLLDRVLHRIRRRGAPGRRAPL
jgi:hypothetical protein